MMSTPSPRVIEDIFARELLDSRGHPTIEAEVRLTGGVRGRALVPSGASTGAYEAHEKRDDDPKRYRGKGVREAIVGIHREIAPLLMGQEACDQRKIDRLMIALDGTDNKQRLGGNAILAVSLAVAHAAANAQNLPLYRAIGGMAARVLPVPMMNILNGGVHADNGMDVQEFMILPIGFTRFSESLRAGTEIFHHLRDLLKSKGHSVNIGDEGGFAPDLPSTEAGLDFIIQAIAKAGYQAGKDVWLALDCAASEYYQDGKYVTQTGKNKLTSEQNAAALAKLTENYPIFSIEDGMAEDDWQGWQALTESLGARVQLVGDDLFVTNPKRLQQGIDKRAGNAMLAKINQIGSLSETLNAVALAYRHGYNVVMSHRSGETEDCTIADLAVAVNCGQMKTGSVNRSDRLAKYNQLLRIEEELGDAAEYAGKSILAKFTAKS